MTAYRKGDVVLVDVEFTDRTGSKLRPAVVLSVIEYNQNGQDVVIAPITSNLGTTPHLGDYRVVFWQRAGLLAPGIVQAKPTTVEAMFIKRQVGTLLFDDLAGVEAGLRQALDLPR
mgnify:CR=1 FL=1